VGRKLHPLLHVFLDFLAFETSESTSQMIWQSLISFMFWDFLGSFLVSLILLIERALAHYLSLCIDLWRYYWGCLFRHAHTYSNYSLLNIFKFVYSLLILRKICVITHFILKIEVLILLIHLFSLVFVVFTTGLRLVIQLSRFSEISILTSITRSHRGSCFVLVSLRIALWYPIWGSVRLISNIKVWFLT